MSYVILVHHHTIENERLSRTVYYPIISLIYSIASRIRASMPHGILIHYLDTETGRWTRMVFYAVRPIVQGIKSRIRSFLHYELFFLCSSQEGLYSWHRLLSRTGFNSIHLGQRTAWTRIWISIPCGWLISDRFTIRVAQSWCLLRFPLRNAQLLVGLCYGRKP